MASQSTSRALTIHELPRSERPRERLLDLGARALSSSELLAVVLGSGGAGRSALRLGEEILAAAGGSLRRIAMQPVAALRTVGGVGVARAVTIHASLELGRRMAAESREDGAPLRSPGTWWRCSRRGWKTCRSRSFTWRYWMRSIGWNGT